MNTVCSKYNAPTSRDPGHGCWCSDLPNALPVPDRGTTGALSRLLDKEAKATPLASTIND
jgi:hypothetical protein